MTSKQAIRELREKVEAGKWIVHAGRAVFGSEMHPYWQAYQAFRGSLDAALALHEAVLPDGEGWEVYRTGKYPGMIPGSSPYKFAAQVGYGTKCRGAADTPARSWLIAILKAMEND